MITTRTRTNIKRTIKSKRAMTKETEQNVKITNITITIRTRTTTTRTIITMTTRKRKTIKNEKRIRKYQQRREKE